MLKIWKKMTKIQANLCHARREDVPLDELKRIHADIAAIGTERQVVAFAAEMMAEACRYRTSTSSQSVYTTTELMLQCINAANRAMRFAMHIEPRD